MRREWTLSATIVVLAAVAGCHAPTTRTDSLGTARPSVAAATGATLTFRLQGPLRRLFLAEPTNKVRLTIAAPDLKEPVEKTVALDPGAQRGSVKDLPPGERRVVTLRFLTEDDKELDSLYYRTVVATLAPGPNEVVFNDLETAYGDVFADMLARFPEQAAIADTSLIALVVDDTIREFKVASPRLLDAKKIAEALKDATTKNIPKPDAAWVAKPGYISIGFLDFPPSVPVRVSVSDAISSPIVSRRGETVMVGPLAPRPDPYTVKLTPVLEEGSPDLVEQTFPVTVSQDRTVSKFPSVFFSKTTPGAPLPDQVGGGAGVTVGDALWIVGGLLQPSGDPAGIIGQPRVRALDTTYRFTRAGNWTTPIPLPETFPVYGAGVVADGTKIYVIGGQRDGLGMDRVHIIDTTKTDPPTVSASPAKLSAGRYNISETVHISECTAAKVGGKILVVGGYTNVPNRPDLPFEAFSEMLSYDIEKDAFDLNPPQGLGKFEDLERVAETGGPRAGLCGAVVGANWYVFGGWSSPERAVATCSKFDTDWSLIEPMPTPRAYAAAVVVDGKIWVIGGEERKAVPSRAVEVYDPASNKWTIRAPLKVPRSLPACGVIKGGDGKPRIVVAGGVRGIDPTHLGLPVPADKVEEITP